MPGLIDVGGGLNMLPPPPDCCQLCAQKHEPHLPHNAQSLFYQMRFQAEHGRSATWVDAMSHCAESVRKMWREALAEYGIDVDAGQVHPPRTGH